MGDDVVACIAVVLIFGGPLAALVIWRVLAHQERIEMIRRGYIPPPDPRMTGGWRRGGWGPGPIPPPGTTEQPMSGYGPPPPPGQFEYYAQAHLRKGIMLTMIGFALLIGLSFIGPLSGIFFFGPWMLGGLIPMFVGIAQIINAILNGARLPGAWTGWGPQSSSFGPPPGRAQQQGTSGADPSSGPYGWRPGPQTEIPKPTQPPDRR
jgi:hypothetical protein